MNCEPEDTIAAEDCNQAHQQRSGRRAPSKPNPEVASERGAYRNAVVEEAAALDAGHNPGRSHHLDERLQLVKDSAYRIKERPLLEMEDLGNDPVRQESEPHENADKNEQTPTGAQATRVKEDVSHSPRLIIRSSSEVPVTGKPIRRSGLTGILIRKLIVDETRIRLI